MIKLDSNYSDYTDMTDKEAYPAGKAVDATKEESIDGTPYLKEWMNNIHGAFTALWVKAFGSAEGMSGKPDSVVHSDVLIAIEKLIDTILKVHKDKRGVDAHGATIAATPGQIISRDQAGRAKAAAPAANDDIARKQEVDAEAKARTDADNALRKEINALGIDLLVPGDIIASPAAGRKGSLLCNGTAVSRTNYAKLFAAIGTTYGAGNNKDTFNLPDFRGCFLRGAGGHGENQSAAIGKKQGDAIRNIEGFLKGRRIQDRWASGALYMFETPNSEDGFLSASVKINYQLGFDASRVVPTAPENRPVNHAINWFIKY